MRLPITANSGAQQERSWPQVLAYAAAALCAGASASTNLLYGLAKGTDLGTSLVWGAVSVATSIIFLLAWPALIRSLNDRQWSQAGVMAIALLLSGSYSITAALGSASGGRTNAAAQEQTVTDQRAKAQAAWESAKRELDALAAVKPGAELQSLIQSARDELSRLPATRPVAEIEARLQAIAQSDPRRYGCVAINGSLRVSCPKLDAERARAEQRERLASDIAKWTAEIGTTGQRHAEAQARAQAAMDKAAAELANTAPAKTANSDAKALSRYLAALGIDIGPDRLGDLLTLLAVAMIEAGGGLALTIGMGLSASPVHEAPDRVAGPAADRTMMAPDRGASSTTGSLTRTVAKLGAEGASTGPNRKPRVGTSALDRMVELLADHGGEMVRDQRSLAAMLNCSKTQVGRALAQLAASGRVRVLADRSGTRVTQLAA
jgi:hypothetical protein